MQTLINFFYRNPKSRLKHFRRFGGYINYRKMMAARKQMEKRSVGLPPVISAPDGLPVYFLTGQNYLYQTLYCIRSLTLVAGTNFRFILVDDGSFDDALINRIKKQLPGADLITKNIIAQNLDKIIPIERYPYLHQKRAVYTHIKKLTDIHTIPGNAWKLVLDSDMLFWHKPDQIMAWLSQPIKPIHMVDCGEAYYYSKKLMEELTGKPIKLLVNVGAIGLNSDTVDWDKLELWARELEQQEGTSYYLEQALSAMLIGNDVANVLPADSYIVNPDKITVNESQGILHHYVDLSKEVYYKTAWKKLI
ncbi:glycosyl transferase [Mucilaginibacter glaciei]|uniref:Glycosyl transferase n=1 Tax=Mucilaginibacter glaciei TaxID=2772109 RepID=A0A926NSW5_9SPHI|nr:glycosyl transferase [Mucilaginibacter glaciei]MBD1394713.1 glycosyl transferase [Mucilaginibacter glaciei]